MMKKLSRFFEKKKHLHKAYQDDTSSVSKKTTYSNICKTVQNMLRDMQVSWLSKKAEAIQPISTYDFSTLYTTLLRVHDLIKNQLEIRLDVKKFFIWLAMKNELFSLPKNIKKNDLWTRQKVTDALIYLWTILY